MSSVRMRQSVERQIAKAVIHGLLADGYFLEVDNGGDEPKVPRTQDRDAILKGMFATDMEHLYAYAPGDRKPHGWVMFVYGNDGWDVISHYTASLESSLKAAQALSDYWSKDGPWEPVPVPSYGGHLLQIDSSKLPRDLPPGHYDVRQAVYMDGDKIKIVLGDLQPVPPAPPGKPELRSDVVKAIQEHLRENDRPDHEISREAVKALSLKDKLKRYLEWEGIQGYENVIMNIFESHGSGG